MQNSMQNEPTLRDVMGAIQGVETRLTDMIIDTVQGLATHMDERFDAVDERFAQVDRRFTYVDQRFTRIDQQLLAIGVEVAAHGKALH